MFKKKSKKMVDQVFFSIGIISDGTVSDEQYEDWSDACMDVAGNVGSTTFVMKENWDAEQIEILGRRFPTVSFHRPFFVVNEMIDEDILQEVKDLEKRHPWKKFFNSIPLSEYMDAEDRAVLNAKKTLLCSNDINEVKKFLAEKNTESRN